WVVLLAVAPLQLSPALMPNRLWLLAPLSAVISWRPQPVSSAACARINRAGTPLICAAARAAPTKRFTKRVYTLPAPASAASVALGVQAGAPASATASGAVGTSALAEVSAARICATTAAIMPLSWLPSLSSFMAVTAGMPSSERGIAFGLRLRSLVARQLAHQHLGNAGALAGQVLGKLLVEQRLVELDLAIVGEIGFDAGIAHALQHLAKEHRLELLRGFLQLRLRVFRGRPLQAIQPVHVQREARRVERADGHYIISRSALSEPAAFNASRIDIRSCGVAPSAFNASTTCIRSAPFTTLRLPCCLVMLMALFCTTVVLPLLKGAG